MNKNAILSTLLFTGLMFDCINLRAQSLPASELTSVRKAIEEANTRYYDLFARKDTSIVDLYTDDGCLLAPNAPPKMGRKGLLKDFEDTFAEGSVKGVKFQTKEIFGDGKELAMEEGTWEVFDPNGKILNNGKYLKMWKLTPDGWKIYRDIFNSNNKAQP
jgi:ketosteroid isomerase-like protein